MVKTLILNKLLSSLFVLQTYKYISLLVLLVYSVIYSFIYINIVHIQANIYNAYILTRTVKIEALHTGSQATGIYIRGGYILTVRHLYENDGGFHTSRITLFNGRQLTPIAIYLSNNADIAIIEVTEQIVDELKIVETPTFGKITLIGNPGDQDFEQVTTSLVPRLFIFEPITQRIKLLPTFFCNGARPGFSGSGMFNDSNEFVGMMTLSMASEFLCAGWSSKEIIRHVNEMKIEGLHL